MAICLATSCSEFDDSDIWDKLNDHESRIAYLEKVCNKMNADIVNLQTIVTALETNDYIVTASPLQDGSGYVLIFKSGKSIIINHGKDGVDGTNGKDGTDGKDGVTPIISVMKDVDGIYYWTINGEWLLINGEKVRASAIDGADGKDGVDGTDGIDGINGKDGITPQFKIENNYWYISYDNGASWEIVGKAIGNDGLNGEDGDDFFKGVSISDGFVKFILNDGYETVINIPYYMNDTLTFYSDKPGDVKTKITNQQKRSIVNLIVKGYIDELDVRYIADQMLALEILDLRQTNLISVPEYAFCKGPVKYGKETIRKVYLPETCTSIKSNAFYGCTNLEYLEAKGNVTIANDCFSYCDGVSLMLGSSVFLGSSYVAIKIDTLSFCGPQISKIKNVTINHMVVKNTVETVQKCETGFFETLRINSIEFEKPSLIQSIDMGFLVAYNLAVIEIPESIKEISGRDTYPFAMSSIEKIIIPEDSQLEYWELEPTYLGHIEEIHCFKAIPPTLEWNFATSSRVYPTIYVPVEHYSTYANAPIWKDFTIKTIIK